MVNTSGGVCGTAEPDGMLVRGASGCRRVRLQPVSVMHTTTATNLYIREGLAPARERAGCAASAGRNRGIRWLWGEGGFVRLGSRRNPPGDGGGEVVHRHRVTRAAVVTRDH